VIGLGKPFAGNFPITQYYGERPWVYGQWGLAGHNGTDWGTPNDTELLAPMSGLVRHWSDPGGYGYNVEITQGEYYVILGHGVEGGYLTPDAQWVDEGRPVLVSDNTGFSSGPHLHLGLRYTDQRMWTGPMRGWLDPLPLINITGADPVAYDLEALKQRMEWAFQLQHEAVHNMMDYNSLSEEVRKEFRRAEIGVVEARGEITLEEANRLRSEEGL
jgi:murein DD-endopeptidase MepM/ murein hydrolase activator NlpD